MEHWTSLRDPAMEDALIEVPIMRGVAGIGSLASRRRGQGNGNQSPKVHVIAALRNLFLARHRLSPPMNRGLAYHLGLFRNKGISRTDKIMVLLLIKKYGCAQIGKISRFCCPRGLVANRASIGENHRWCAACNN